MERRAYSISEVSRATGTSKSFLRKRIAAGDIKAVKIGKRVLIPKAALDELLNEKGK